MHLPTPPPVPDWQKPVMFYGKPLTFNPNTHRYTWDGKHVPSVTTILRRLDKPQLIQWAANCAVDHLKKLAECGVALTATDLEEARKAHTVIRDTAGDVGTKVHELARNFLAGAPIDPKPIMELPEQAIKALQAFDKWYKQHRIQPIDLERRVFSAELHYAGTCDFYGTIDDEPAILDFKTGNGVYNEAWYQLAGYERALWEELRWVVRPVHWVVHLNKTTGECAAYRRTPAETVAAYDVWSSLVALDKAIRAMPKPERAA